MNTGVTICLHASDQKVGEMQLSRISNDLQNLENYHLRKRWEIHPDVYSSYSEMINHCINDSKNEIIILMNDKVVPKNGEIIKLLSLINAGFGYVGLYSIGFCAISKSLIKKVGWLDERYLGGGYEDDDFLLRLKLNDVAIYDSHESNYNYMAGASKQSVSVPLSKSEPHFNSKWKFYEDKVEKVISEEDYSHKYNCDPLQKTGWMPWNCSILGYCYGVGPKEGIPYGHPIENYQGFSRAFRFSVVPYGGRLVGNNRQVIDLTRAMNA